jgi:chromosomal replication initiation ATPase DnaA
METYALAPNIFRPRNDWALVNLRYKRNITPFKSFVQEIANVIKSEIGVNPFEEVDYRGRNYVLSRQLLMVMLRRYTTKNLSAIGRIVGDKDHATVIHAIKTIDDLCETDKKFNELFFRINNEVLNFLKPF